MSRYELTSTLRTARAIACTIAVLTVFGCVPKNADTRRNTYFAGPTEPLSVLVNTVNKNNAPIASLWSRLSFQAWIYDDNKKETYASGDGNLQYRRPEDFWLRLNDAAFGEVLTLGTNPDQYWLIVKPSVDTMWWGRTQYIGTACAGQMPIDPTLVAQVLGVGQIPTNFLDEPVPILRFNNDEGVYAVSWNVRLANGWAAQREVWYDHETKLPVRVLLYGDKGRVLLRANLGGHQSVKTDKGPDVPGKIATMYDLSFPDSGSHIILRLDAPAVSRGEFPKDSAFVLPVKRPGVKKVIQIDEACGP